MIPSDIFVIVTVSRHACQHCRTHDHVAAGVRTRYTMVTHIGETCMRHHSYTDTDHDQLITTHESRTAYHIPRHTHDVRIVYPANIAATISLQHSMRDQRSLAVSKRLCIGDPTICSSNRRRCIACDSGLRATRGGSPRTTDMLSIYESDNPSTRIGVVGIVG